MDVATLIMLWPVLRDVIAFVWGVLPMPLTDLLLWQFVYLPLLLAALYPVAIQYERGGWWRVLLPVTAVAALIDVWLNWTAFSVYLWSAPGRREYTFSQHLERLVHDTGWRGRISRAIARYTNLFDPTPPHVALP